MVSGLSPEKKRGGVKCDPPRFHTYKELFEYMCPFYMAMGMSYHEFWYEDCDQIFAYQKKDEIEQERKNEYAWLHGIYLKDAIQNTLYGKKHKYPEEPYPLNTSVSRERAKLIQEQNERKSTDYFMTFMEQWNKKFAKRNAVKKSDTRPDSRDVKLQDG